MISCIVDKMDGNKNKVPRFGSAIVRTHVMRARAVRVVHARAVQCVRVRCVCVLPPPLPPPLPWNV